MPTTDIAHIRAKGKFLLTGEYVVLDGAEALALPLRYGQTLRVTANDNPGILQWQARDHEGNIWFSAEFALPDISLRRTSDEKTAATLQAILRAIRRQNATFLPDNQGFNIVTQVDFPRKWGLGTSSTLIAALSRWGGADAYRVLAETLGGSGYDIACAFAPGPLLYHVEKADAGEVFQQKNAVSKNCPFRPPFSEALFFVYLGKKQDSREGIMRYRALSQKTTELVQKISLLTQRAVAAEDLEAFDAVMDEHEHLISEALALPRAKNLHFPDYWGQIKSLGAWGGDFVLASSTRSPAETKRYFWEKGHEVILDWKGAVE